MGMGFDEKFEIKHKEEREFIEERAKSIADQIINQEKRGSQAVSTPEGLAWETFDGKEQSEPDGSGGERERAGTRFLANQIATRAKEIGGEELERALRFGTPSYPIDERRANDPGFNPLGIEKKE